MIKELIKNNNEVIKKIFKIAIPSVLDLLAQTLIATTDMIMVGSLGATAISSIGVGSAAMYALIPSLISVTTGTAALLSRAYGAKNQTEGKKVFAQSFYIALPLGIFLMILFLFFSEQIINLIGNTKDMNLKEAIIYQNITALSFPFLTVGIVTFYAFRALGQNKIPMIGNTLALLVNLVCNYLFIYIFKWGVFGAALGTTFARLSVLILSVYLIFINKNQWISLDIKKMKFDYHLSKRILKVAIPAAIEQLGLRFGMLIFEMMVISLGNLSYAAHKIALVGESFSFNLGFAFSFAATALVGQELGRNSPKQALKKGYICTIIAVIVMSTMGIIFLVAPNLLVSLFSKDENVVALSIVALRLVSICQPFSAMSLVLSGALRGAGDTKSVLFITFVGIFLVRIPTTYLFLYVLKLGLSGAWIVMTIDLFVRSSALLYVFKRGKWKYLTV